MFKLRKLRAQFGRVVRPIAAGLAISLMPVLAEAGWLLSGYSGFKDSDTSNTSSVPDPILSTTYNSSNLPIGTNSYYDVNNGVVNFAVYQNNGGTGNWLTDLGINTGTPTTFSGLGTGPTITGLEAGVATMKYVYFYQVSNLGAAAFQDVKIDQVGAGSFGYLKSTVFNDAAVDGGKVGGATNLFLGAGTTVSVSPGNTAALGTTSSGQPEFSASTPPSFLTQPSPTVQSNSYLGNNLSPFATNSSTIATKSGNLVPAGDPIAAAAGGSAVLFTFVGQNGIPREKFSDVLFIASNQMPGFYTSQIDGGALTIKLGGGQYDLIAGNRTYNALPGPYAAPPPPPPPVPVPGSLVLLGTALPGLIWWRRRSRCVATI